MDERDANHPPFDEEAAKDRALWAPVNAAPVPPADPAFMTSLMARLDDADAEARPATAATAQPARRWWSGRRLRFAVAAAAAAAFALGIVLVNLPGESTVTGPAPDIVAARARMDEAMASIKTLQGDLVISSTGAAQAARSSVQFVNLGQNDSALVQSSPSSAGELRISFVLTAEGDARLEGGHPGQGDHFLTTFDSHSQTVCELVEQPGVTPSYTEYSGENALPGGPFDPLARLNRMLGSYVRGILDEGAPGWQVADVTYEGRAAWQLTGPAPETQLPSEQRQSTAPGARDLQIVIDKQMGLPLRLASSSNGRLVHEERLENLLIDAPQTADQFTQSPPAQATVRKIDYGYRGGSLSWAARTMDYRPLIPTLLPAGYHLAAVYCQAQTPSSTQTAWTSSADRGVTLVYRRGFDTFVVATHALADDVPSWGGANGIVSTPLYGSPEAVTLTGGELAGASAQVSVTYQKPPMLIVNTGKREYLVGGGLSRSELLQVANSLTKWSP